MTLTWEEVRELLITMRRTTPMPISGFVITPEQEAAIRAVAVDEYSWQGRVGSIGATMFVVEKDDPLPDYCRMSGAIDMRSND